MLPTSARSARDVLAMARATLAPAEDGNRLVPLLAAGRAPRSVFATIAAEETRIVHSDWRSFLTVAGRCAEPHSRRLFSALADGEALALSRLAALRTAIGMSPATLRAYQPKAGCQAYPAYVAWLCLYAEPADVIVALLANFAAWGGYCGAVAGAMRDHYGFDDEACGFFDYFSAPAPDIEDLAVDALQAAIDARRDSEEAFIYGRLFQSYELMFWNTIADECAPDCVDEGAAELMSLA